MKLKAKEAKKGFTLVEFVVALAISSLIVALVLANHTQFRRKVELTNLGYEMALAIREAQVYGTSVRGVAGDFSAGFGIHFDSSDLTSFFLFHDSSPTGFGDGEYIALDDIILETFRLREGVLIDNFCRINATTPNDNCLNDMQGVGHEIDTLDITFQRPDPRARLEITGCSSCAQSEPPGRATITLISVDGDTQVVEVNTVGQISVK
jgi:prepilin-type N-terminal cleavage/methylation domain-containing protein